MLLERSNRSPNDISSIVLVEQDKSYIKSEAILRIATHLQNPFPFLAQFGLPVPLFLRDSFYDTVSLLLHPPLVARWAASTSVDVKYLYTALRV